MPGARPLESMLQAGRQVCRTQMLQDLVQAEQAEQAAVTTSVAAWPLRALWAVVMYTVRCMLLQVLQLALVLLMSCLLLVALWVILRDVLLSWLVWLLQETGLGVLLQELRQAFGDAQEVLQPLLEQLDKVVPVLESFLQIVGRLVQALPRCAADLTNCQDVFEQLRLLTELPQQL